MPFNVGLFPHTVRKLDVRLVMLIMPSRMAGIIVLRDGCDSTGLKVEFNYMISNSKGALVRELNIIYC